MTRRRTSSTDRWLAEIGGAIRAIVVDDSLTVRMDIADALTEAGFDVVPCGSLDSARASIAEAPPGLVVLDVLLPDGDGLDLLRELRRAPATADAPALILAGPDGLTDEARGLGGGTIEFVGKPYDLKNLVARARSLVKMRARASSKPSRTILLIDDSATFRGLVREALEAAGYGVVEAVTGEDGLLVAASLRPDAVVVDGQLPGIDGRTVVRRIRSDASLRSTPCLLLTAADTADDERLSLDAGADAFTRKSEDFGVLLARLEALLRRKRSGDSGTMPSLLAPKRILAVDDSPTYLHELASHLRAEGYDVALASSGAQAIELLGAQPVDCILMDLVMPGLSGEETCRRIKATGRWRDIPLVLLTSRDDRDAMIDGINAGADDFISKSADLEILKARVRAQIRRRHIEDESRRLRDTLVRREIEARFQRLLHSNLIGVIVADSTGRLLDANDAFLEMVGFSRSALARGVLDLLSITAHDARSRTAAAIEEARSTGAAPRFETELVRPDARRVAVVVGFVLPEDGQTLVGFVLDRTEQKEAQEALRRSHEALERANRELVVAKAHAERSSQFKSSFLANMSHELRTPLNAIIGFSELIVSGAVRPGMPEHDEFIGDILTSGRHLHRLINDVLDLSKVEAGKLEFHPENVDVGAVVSEVVGVLRAVAAERKVAVRTELDDLGAVRVDPARLKQVLYNYTSNALKFSRAGATVTIRARAEGTDAFRVEVEDHGAGIAAQDIGRLFAEFQQLDTGAAKRHEGTGLGLALTKRLVEAQGGSVGVKSAVGEGSTFHAVLPRRAVSPR